MIINNMRGGCVSLVLFYWRCNHSNTLHVLLIRDLKIKSSEIRSTSAKQSSVFKQFDTEEHEWLVQQTAAELNLCFCSFLFSPAAEHHLSSNRFFLSFCFSFFLSGVLRFASFHTTSPSIVLRLIQRRTMRQSSEQLFSVNSAVILALCIPPLMLLNATPGCCSARLVIKAIKKKNNPFTLTVGWVKCLCGGRGERNT